MILQVTSQDVFVGLLKIGDRLEADRRKLELQQQQHASSLLMIANKSTLLSSSSSSHIDTSSAVAVAAASLSISNVITARSGQTNSWSTGLLKWMDLTSTSTTSSMIKTEKKKNTAALTTEADHDIPTPVSTVSIRINERLRVSTLVLVLRTVPLPGMEGLLTEEQ
eukprot:gene8845-18326_t